MTDGSGLEVRDELRRVCRDALRGRTPGDEVEWAMGAELGWWGLEAPDASGGGAASFAECAVVVEEIARVAGSGPMVGSAVLAGGALGMLADGVVARTVADALATGVSRPVLVHPARFDAARCPFTLARSGASWRLNGSVDEAVDVTDADILLVPACSEEGDLLVALVPSDRPGMRVQSRPVIDATRSLGSLNCDAVRIGDDEVAPLTVSPDHFLARLGNRCALACACDSLGIAEAMLERTVAYVGQREQFGRPIGSFQAVKHACADVAVAIETGRALCAEAVDALVAGTDDPRASWAVSRAKAWVGEAGVAAAGTAMQLHGGIGYSWDSGIHTYLKRATVNRVLFGSPAEHRRRLARHVSRIARS